MTRFSVIIPTYNRQDYLLQCLKSVEMQKFQPHEVIVVDDGSTDGTREIIETMQSMTLIRQENLGPSAARNNGASVASGDYLAFLDSDDLWMPWTLETIASLVQKYDQPALMFSSFLDFLGREPSGIKKSPAEGRHYPDFFSSSNDGCFAGAGMMFIRKDVFHASSGFTEDRLNAEDHDLALQLGDAAGFVQVQKPVTLAHRVHDGNEMGNLESNLDGLLRIVQFERSGRYPGGQARARERRNIITRHVRAAVFSALQEGRLSQALRLYRYTFFWNLRAGRGLFLAAIPIMAVMARIQGRRSN